MPDCRSAFHGPELRSMTVGLICVSQPQHPKSHANPVKVKLQLYSGYPVPASLPDPRAAPQLLGTATLL